MITAFEKPLLKKQSGGKFSHSITSDCLSRLEDGGRVHFDDEVIRDVSGVLFGGEFVSGLGIYTRVSHG